MITLISIRIYYRHASIFVSLKYFKIEQKVNQSHYRPGVPEGSRKLRFPDYVTTAQDGGKVVSLMHRPIFTPRKYSLYSFLLEAEAIPVPQCARKDFMSMKYSIETSWNFFFVTLCLYWYLHIKDSTG